MQVSLIILNWNGYKDTLSCLDSVRKLNITDFKLQVVVIDNASTDESVESLIDYKIPDASFELILNKNNLGYAGGMNVGIKNAIKNNSDYVLLLNNDVRLDEMLLVKLLESAESDTVGIVVPKIYFEKGYEFHKDRYKTNQLGKVIWYAGGILDWDNVYGKNRGVDEVDHGQYDNACETDFATGNCMLVNVGAIRDAGVFNEDYYMYMEDMELSQRFRIKGWKIIFTPEALLWHKVAQSSGIGSGLNDYFTTRNRLIFGMKYAKFRTKVALVRESIRMLLNGRKWQKRGVIDFYLRNFGKGSWV